MQHRRRFQGAFTLAEIIISILVISIALLGTLSALAFGYKSTDISAHKGEALAVQRRILELILIGGPKGPVTAGPGLPLNPAVVTANPQFPTATGDGWVTLAALTNSTTSPGTPYSKNDFAQGTSGIFSDTQDERRWADIAERYQIRVATAEYNDGTSSPLSFKNQMVNVTVGVRWLEKQKRWQLQTTGIYRRRG